MVERTEMETRRLDDLLPQIPGRGVDYLKIDVQGFELSVLKGAEQALKEVLVIHTEAPRLCPAALHVGVDLRITAIIHFCR